MNQLIIIFKLSWKFSKKYFIEYLLFLGKYILVFLTGIGLTLLSLNSIIMLPFVAFFILLPCMFYSFWRCYLLIFILNDVSISFLKNDNNNSIKEKLANFDKEKRKKLIDYLVFASTIILIGFLPSLVAIIPHLKDLFLGNFENLSKYLPFLTLNSIILFPFLHFINQTYYLKKENENFFNLFINCYKYLDTTGVLILIIFAILNLLVNIPIIGTILGIFIVFFMIPINVLWFYGRINQTKF